LKNLEDLFLLIGGRLRRQSRLKSLDFCNGILGFENLYRDFWDLGICIEIFGILEFV